ELRQHDHVAQAIRRDPVEIIFLIVNTVDLASVHAVFAGWDVEHGGEQVKGSVVFEVAEFPQFHRVLMEHLPRLFPREAKQGWKRYAVNEHPPADIRKVKFLAIVGT